MDIIERKNAKELGLKTYFTGRICRNGHITYRYTNSGSCCDCVNGAKPVGYADYKRELTQCRARIFHFQKPEFTLMVWAFAAIRWPAITERDIDPRFMPTDSDDKQGLHAFYCHPDDMAAIKVAAIDLMKHVKFDSARESILANIMREEAPADTTPPFNWK